jgi:arylsulfatase A-like enzyme
MTAASERCRGQGSLTRRDFLAVLSGGVLGLACDRRSSPRAGAPHLLVIVTDDQRADSLGCMGNAVVRTPNIDALAADGALFESAFVTTSICPTSRASILSGQWMKRHGIGDFSTPLSATALSATYPFLLSRVARYRTGFVGKWGIGGRQPTELFDEFRGFSGQGSYFESVGDRRVHSTELLTDQAIAFLERHDEDRPFCLSVSFKAPHGPFSEYDPRFRDLYRGTEIPLPPSATPEAARSLPDFLRDPKGIALVRDRDALSERIRGYYRLLTGLDAALARLLDALARLGFAEETVVVFTSDNGMLMGEHGRIGKWLMYEESIRVPLVIRDPRLSAEQRRRHIREMALNVDIAPTLLELAGIPVPDAVQGRSLVPLLRGEAVTWREDWFYEHHHLRPEGGLPIPAMEGVRSRDWKYVRYLDAPSDEGASLFDLRADRYELRDLAALPEHAERVELFEVRRRELAAAVA